ncbi:activin receptor type-2B-like [Onthophagus taurus]|uniref:activin receptor type-2B-like n=1 Tax=Onthophagus taurus TaxID=166361 RepID=UPI0039BDBD08
MSVSIVFILILNISWSLSNPKATNYVQPLTTTQCEEYQKECQENCSTTENCTAPEDGKRNHCYVLWEMNANNTPNVHMKGCFLNNEKCFDQERCVSKEHSKMLYCCCEGDYCNKEFFWEPSPTTTTPVAGVESPLICDILANANEYGLVENIKNDDDDDIPTINFKV